MTNEELEKLKSDAESGDAFSQCELGYHYIENEDYEKALFWYRKAAEQDYGMGLYNVGLCYEYGEGVEKNLETAVEYYHKAAQQGDADAQCMLGCYYGEGTKNPDFEKSFFWFQKSAEQGNLNAKFNLSSCYEYGEGVKRDRKKANALLLEVAAAGYPLAQYYVAFYYRKGRYGFPKDLKKAFSWYRKSAMGGDEDAQIELARLYDSEKNYKKALYWYRRAAKQGNIDAVSNLGYFYSEGLGVEKDYKRANKYFFKAAEQGDEVAMYNLGNSYESGEGVEKDIQKAIEWYEKAAALGDKDADKALKRLKENK